MADTHDPQSPRAMVDLTVRQEKTLLRPTGSRRHAVFGIRANMLEADMPIARRPLTLALTLDRSGSMSGEPLRMAKQVALSLIDSLTEQDEAAVVIFDDKIETRQELAAMTPAVKAQVRQALAQVEARAPQRCMRRGSTSARRSRSDDRTGGAAGALPAADRRHGRRLARPMSRPSPRRRRRARERGRRYQRVGLGRARRYRFRAVAGGQFDELRAAGDLAKTFMGERDELLAVVALRTGGRRWSRWHVGDVVSAIGRRRNDRQAERAGGTSAICSTARSVMSPCASASPGEGLRRHGARRVLIDYVASRSGPAGINFTSA